MISKRIAKNIIIFFIFAASFMFTNANRLFAQEKSDGKEKKSATKESVTTITINNARQTSYKKDEKSGNDIIVLEGSVELSVTKDKTTSQIKADKITYDRKTEMLFAEGNVEITTKDSGAGGETATASAILMNTSTLEGVFDDGRIVKTQSDSFNLPSGSTLIVFSNVLGKGENNVIAFKNSSLTFCDEDDPHWHIDATRTWLLPGGEFAFFNALLYIGKVPVLYFPAFYYPKDDLIFNPVFSYEKRKGYSFQTTTYLLGRKPLDKSSSDTSNSKSSSSSSSKDSKIGSSADSLKSVFNFIKPSSLKEQKLEGIVLHNLDEDFKGDTSSYIKIVGDWYSRLGYMVGLDGNLQFPKSFISKATFNAYFGFSNTVFKTRNGEFVPYSPSYKTYKDSSTFLGVTLPFRYGANLALQMSKPFSVSLSVPIYSDPFFAYDFKTDRSESMDWISFFLDNSKDSKDKSSQTPTEISSLTWQFQSSISPSIPSNITPYISSLSWSLNSSVNISSKNTDFNSFSPSKKAGKESEWMTYTPERRFYFPSAVNPANVNFSIKGTIFSYPAVKKTSANTPSYAITMNKPDELKTEKQLKEEKEAAKENQEVAEQSKNKESENKEKSENSKIFEYEIPELENSISRFPVADGISYKLSYSLATTLNTQLSYSSVNLKTSEDFKWKNYRSFMYVLKLPASVASNFNYGGGFFTIDNSISYSPIWQEHSFINVTSTEAEGGYTQKSADALRLADYKAESRDIVNSNTFTLKPFIHLDMLSDSNVSWNTNIKLFRRILHEEKNKSVDLDNPVWENKILDWSDDKSVTANTLSTVISTKEFDKKFSQALTLSIVMPPLLRQYNASLALTFPYVTASIGTGYSEKTKDDVPFEQKWKKNPLSQNMSISLFNSKLSISESYVYNLQDNQHDSFRLSVSGFGATVAYVHSYATQYNLIRVPKPGETRGWNAKKDKEFKPYSLSFSYTMPSKTFYSWFNRISFAPGLKTSLVADLVRPTNSYLTFSPSLTFKINKFLNLTFSATSQNSILYWYFHNERNDPYSDWGGFPGNILKDLIDSFNFGNKSAREQSGFKLKSLNMTLSHDLHDWSFNMTFKIEPRLVTENGNRRYDFNPYISVGIVWNPMESIKTTIIDEYGEWRLE
ncbi:LPS-assembly protein LptD [Treponema sp. Marseille-Q3903]|uniref:LPS-assembly protein LptD n=1 Tax=Treponema sp. Marseille-Q3903 TaxID=2766703 RepID=UPI001651B595|nr:LPS-assembly protein LptD [Treponema sp. Marseille-Q3903]MBC6713390.1 LPS-assembly protein LptD [Treponema sp. Marseille-Q3903]